MEIEQLNESQGPRLLVVCGVLLALVLMSMPRAEAALTETEYEQCLVSEVNQSRIDAGRTALAFAPDLALQVRAFSAKMAADGHLRHMTNSERGQILPGNWTSWGENVYAASGTYGPSCSQVHDSFMGSSLHRANILGADFQYSAIGVHIGDEGTWVTELFFRAPGYHPAGEGRFWDDDGSVFESAIEKLATAGITNGCNPPVNDRFCPDQPVTRGQMAAFFGRALGLSDGSGASFVDDDGSVFESAIEKLATAGIT
ncbi:MAG: S-layer homology domain-containing protein, partial [Acidimicrobiia bacterium]